MEIPYKTFNQYVLRTPIFPNEFYEKLTSKKENSDDELKELFQNVIINEGIYLASPSLHAELIKWTNGDIKNRKRELKLKYSFFKYLSRLSSRSTPFGLFAGCSVGNISEKTIIRRDGISLKRNTRLDMNYLMELSQDLSNRNEIKQKLKYFPNSSIYTVGNQIRYVEYNYIEGVRKHFIIIVDAFPVLNYILEIAKNGKTIIQIVELLKAKMPEISQNSGVNFIMELISNQILISEIEPSVTGPEYIDQILKILKKTDESLYIKFNDIKIELHSLDFKTSNTHRDYSKLSKKCLSLDGRSQNKYLFQTDTTFETTYNTISRDTIKSVSRGLKLLNKISFPSQEILLREFTTKFYERFGEREIPLSKALDFETGIIFKGDGNTGDINSLIDDLKLSGKKHSGTTYKINWNNAFELFRKKINESVSKGEYILRLKEKDFKEFSENWKDLPDTFSVMINILYVDGKEKIKIKGGGGSSAANLIARFGHNSDELLNHISNITKYESQANPNSILAEILHLPESRVGNILMRPSLRDYEIPYLSNTSINQSKKININDLILYVNQNNELIIKSLNHDKPIIPYLTNAHTYDNKNSLPVYQFLSHYQFKDKRKGVWIDLGPFENEYTFIPRIEYHNLILREASWNFKHEQIKTITDSLENDKELFNKIELFRENWKIPSLVLLIEGDNELLINFENLTCIKMFLDIVKNYSFFKLKEYLFSEDSAVKDADDNNYAHEILLAFFNSKKLNFK